jgi:hypothetical protein
MWELMDADGKKISAQANSFQTMGVLMERFQVFQASPHEAGFTVGPGSRRLVSMNLGMGTRQPGAGCRLPNPPRPPDHDNKSRNIVVGLPADSSPAAAGDSAALRVEQGRAAQREMFLRRKAKLQGTVSVTVSLDGAFLDDGAFIGPDNSGFFSKVVAQHDARRGLYTKLLTTAWERRLKRRSTN